MIKHIGRHDNKKVVVLFRTVPNEASQCLVVYSELLPRTYHDAVMSILESDVGQQANEFADALFRNLLPDGRNILDTLHREGLIKKLPTSQVIITPDSKSSCRLDELNKILRKVGDGEGEALAEADAQSGLYDPKKSDSIPAPAPVVENTVDAEGNPVVVEAAPVSQEQLITDLRSGIEHVKRLEKQLRSMRIKRV
jgi:hypothetical protein